MKRQQNKDRTDNVFQCRRYAEMVERKDYTSVLYETRITADQDRESIVRDICQNIISNGK